MTQSDLTSFVPLFWNPELYHYPSHKSIPIESPADLNYRVLQDRSRAGTRKKAHLVRIIASKRHKGWGRLCRSKSAPSWIKDVSIPKKNKAFGRAISLLARKQQQFRNTDQSWKTDLQ